MTDLTLMNFNAGSKGLKRSFMQSCNKVLRGGIVKERAMNSLKNLLWKGICSNSSLQLFLSGPVKEEQGVEGDGDADVVDDGDCKVSLIVPISILIEAFDLKDDDNQRHDGLDEAELKCSLFAEPRLSKIT